MIPSGVTAQRARIAFDEKHHQLGQIEEGNGIVSRTFTFTNKGNAPVIILDVESSCGCTVPEWSDHPVLPGKPGTITVNFNPANLSGKFSKKITIYFSGDVTADLRISGEVIADPGDMERRYPVSVGALRMSADTVFLHAGKRSHIIHTFNAGKKKITITSIMKPNDVTIDQTPVLLLPGFRGDLVFFYSPTTGTGRETDRVLITTSEGVTGIVTVNRIPRR
jgi:hypothetical protein